MRRRLLLVLLASCLAPVGVLMNGCGSEVTETDGLSQVDAGKTTKHDASTTGSGASTGSGEVDPPDALPDYVDPGCPDAGPKITMFACDPYNQGNGDCGPGQGCYVYVTYPTEVCGQEIYGSTCSAAGNGQQGSACGGAGDCGAGFVCVVSGSGTQCVQLCKLEGDDGCPEGLVCESIDVEGIGGCL